MIFFFISPENFVGLKSYMTIQRIMHHFVKMLHYNYITGVFINI